MYKYVCSSSISVEIQCCRAATRPVQAHSLIKYSPVEKLNNPSNEFVMESIYEHFKFLIIWSTTEHL